MRTPHAYYPSDTTRDPARPALRRDDYGASPIRIPAYEALALALGRDRPRLAALRDRLRRNRATHPLFDMTRYARDFGELLDALGRSAM